MGTYYILKTMSHLVSSLMLLSVMMMVVVVQGMPEPLVPDPSGPISVKKRGDIDAPMAHKTKRATVCSKHFLVQTEDGTAEYSGNKDKSKAETIQTIQKEADYVGQICEEIGGKLRCWDASFGTFPKWGWGKK